MTRTSTPRSGVAALVVGLALLAGACSSEADPPRAATRDPLPASSLPVRIAHVELASGATTVRELAQVGALAVLARAGESRQTSDPDDPLLPSTHQAFAVEETYFGSAPPAEFEVVMTGGRVDPPDSEPYLLQLEHQPQFIEGDTYLLVLLGPTDQGEYTVVGGSQGRYAVASNRLRAVAGTETGPVQRALHGLTPDQAKALLMKTRGAVDQ